MMKPFLSLPAHLIGVAGLFAFAAVSGCQLNQEDSREVWGTVSNKLGTPSGQALTASNTLTLTRDCEDGGEMTFDGSFEADTESEDVGDELSLSAAFEYNVTFEGCQEDGDTIDGVLVYSSTLDVSAGDGEASAALLFHYDGSIAVQGEHSGACTIDMDGHFEASASEEIGSAGASFVYEGSICGHDASETLSVSVSAD